MLSGCSIRKDKESKKHESEIEKNIVTRNETVTNREFEGSLDVPGTEIENEVNTNFDETKLEEEQPVQIFENDQVKVTFQNTKKGKGKIKAETKPQKMNFKGKEQTTSKTDIKYTEKIKEETKEANKHKDTKQEFFAAVCVIAALIAAIWLIVFMAKRKTPG